MDADRMDVSGRDVLLICSDKLRIPMKTLISKDRHKRIARARQACYYVARHTTGLSYPELGKLFHRDHTTILYGVRTMEKLVKHNENLRVEIAGLIKEVMEC